MNASISVQPIMYRARQTSPKDQHLFVMLCVGATRLKTMTFPGSALATRAKTRQMRSSFQIIGYAMLQGG